MRTRIFLIFFSVILLFASPIAMAHTSGPGTGFINALLHVFSGDHLLMLLVVGTCAALLTRLYRHFM